ncbi:hypothetical protein C922_05799 [Plasmodium inui San Antonio 1]|uniref:Uncharacterized protein n=1 Tax=Plasmodium inui San Antonio 1 TaxID=1237626 RepID=W6ZWZ0_9APIC|nr:hypothetical protein C922_05799 [Plasmodium inui San Antonio 1]EUD63818.1 hypothetical protein C922_05799 [Plasmodium inui San Antonio 1]
MNNDSSISNYTCFYGKRYDACEDMYDGIEDSCVNSKNALKHMFDLKITIATGSVNRSGRTNKLQKRRHVRRICNYNAYLFVAKLFGIW